MEWPSLHRTRSLRLSGFRVGRLKVSCPHDSPRRNGTCPSPHICHIQSEDLGRWALPSFLNMCSHAYLSSSGVSGLNSDDFQPRASFKRDLVVPFCSDLAPHAQWIMPFLIDSSRSCPTYPNDRHSDMICALRIGFPLTPGGGRRPHPRCHTS